MLRTTIQTTDGETGEELPVPIELRTRVQRAANILAGEISEVGMRFPVEARWRVARSGGGWHVRLDLTAHGAGVTGHDVPIEALESDDSIGQSLRGPIWTLSRVLSTVLKGELAQIKRDLEVLAATPGE